MWSFFASWGRHLCHVAVVTELTKMGKLEPGKSFGQDFRIKLKLPGCTDYKGEFLLEAVA